MRRLFILISTLCLAFVRIPAAYAGGNIILTGHDNDLHANCASTGDAGRQFAAMVAFARAGAPNPNLRVLSFDHGSQVTCLLTALAIPFTNVDPDVGVPAASLFSVATYSAIVVASQSACDGCDNTPTSAANLARVQASFGTFLDAGGGIVGLSGASVANAYGYLPGSSGAAQFGSPPTSGYVQTAFGASINVPAVNGNATHNFFSAPGFGGTAAIYNVVESNPSVTGNPAVTIAVRNATTQSLTAPVLTSLSPSSVQQSSPNTVLTLAGSGFAAGAIVRWTFGGQTTNLATQFQSATVLQATITANLLTSPGTADVTAVNVTAGVTGSPSNSLPLTITTALNVSTLNPASAPALSPQTALTVSGAGFVSNASVRWTFGGQTTSLQTQFQSAALLQATLPASLLTSPGTAQVSVANPTGAASNSLPFIINPAAVPINVTGLSATPVPTQSTTAVLSLTSPVSIPLNGSVSLTFAANANGVAAGYRDPALQYATGGTSFAFTIPAGATTASAPGIQQGTVAGTITATVTSLLASGLNVLPSPSPNQSVIVPRLPPVIVANTVRITGRAATGFNVELDGYSTPRDLTSAAFTFQAASGSQLVGGPFTVSLSSIAPAWFSDQRGLDGGSRFHLTVPFTYSGDVGALASVSVTLTNSQGTSTTETGS